MIRTAFSASVICDLESEGFRKEGEAFDFIQDGRIELDGELALNTFGEQPRHRPSADYASLTCPTLAGIYSLASRLTNSNIGCNNSVGSAVGSPIFLTKGATASAFWGKKVSSDPATSFQSSSAIDPDAPTGTRYKP
jgi:hypothetical protein